MCRATMKSLSDTAIRGKFRQFGSQSDDHLQQTLLELLPDAHLHHASLASCGSGTSMRLIHFMD
jgi:hypothetical protein